MCVRWVQTSMVIQIALALAGLVLIVKLVLGSGTSKPSNAPWTLGSGLWTVVLAQFWISVGLFFLLALALPREAHILFWWCIIVPVPWILLVRGRLLRPTGAKAREVFGFDAWKGRRHVLLGWAMAAYGVVLVAGQVTYQVASGLGRDDWDSYLSESLVYGSFTECVIVAIGAVVVAPVVEEIGWRGVLYGSLRKRLHPVSAAALAGTAFAATHPYALESLIAVAFSGFVWCMVYERTRSLVPSMLCHAAINAFWMTRRAGDVPIVIVGAHSRFAGKRWFLRQPSNIAKSSETNYIGRVCR